MAAGPIVTQEMYVSRAHPPLRRCVLLGLGGTPDAKRPLAGRSWLRPPSLAEARGHIGNFGCRTGGVGGTTTSLWVLDFDAKAAGLAALAAWEAEYGRIPGWRVRTGSGGLHIYMAGAPGLRSRKLPVLHTGLEVELKADRSYVVFAGSIHENGHRYEPETPEGLGVLAQAPGWLLELARTKATGAEPSPSGTDRRTWVRGGIYDIPTSVYVEALTGCPVGRRGKALCPLHDDHEPTLHAYPDGHWFCSACQVGGRIRQLAAITLDLGHQVENRWEIESHERPAVDALLARLFPEVTR
ncbi:MAG: bifunctional DNA primase/polymerase [Solirubrobacteraceae bacterium]